jgi:hypothetical protein
MRTLRTKDDFIRIVKELKRVRRNFESVNSAGQQALSNIGMFYLEYMNMRFDIEINEHVIAIINHYNTPMLIYGMSPVISAHGDGVKTRFYSMAINIPDFRRLKTQEELQLESKNDFMDKIVDAKTSKYRFKLNNSYYGLEYLRDRSQIDPEPLVDPEPHVDPEAHVEPRI